MCLAVPGKIIAILPDSGGLKMARVDFGGLVKEICIDWVPSAGVGDYALVHVGFALQIVDEEEASAMLELVSNMESLGDEKREENPE